MPISGSPGDSIFTWVRAGLAALEAQLMIAEASRPSKNGLSICRPGNVRSRVSHSPRGSQVMTL